MGKKKIRKKYKKIICIFFIIIISIILLEIVNILLVSNKNLKPIEYHAKDYYYSYDFGFLPITTEADYDEDNIDDYSDYLKGAKQIVVDNPVYVSKYYQGGYPPLKEGVCTDVIWKMLLEAGYYLKDMLAYDMENYYDEGLYTADPLDPNIDFRRVINLRKFFDRYAEKLTINTENIKEFNPGDIIIFENDQHIAIISDKKNENGIPYIIQNSSREDQISKEEDRIEETDMKITQHYRFTYNDKIEKLLKEMGVLDE